MSIRKEKCFLCMRPKRNVRTFHKKVKQKCGSILIFKNVVYSRKTMGCHAGCSGGTRRPPGRPVGGGELTSMLRRVLGARGHCSWVSITLYSLRHTGATLAQLSGADLPEIMAHGTWKSRAVHAYISPTPVPTCYEYQSLAEPPSG